MTQRWYVVQTHTHAEGKAAAHLARQGFDVYLPRYRKRRRHARRVDIVTPALFPRYLFVAVDVSQQRWRSIQSTVGVARLVCNGDAPTPVDNEVVVALRRREDADGLVCLPQAPRFAAGEKVRILDGAFAACVGLFEGMSDNDRVAVLLDMLGRKVRVVMDELLVSAA